MKFNNQIEDYLKDSQTIIISGIESAYYPKKLIRKIKDSGIKDLTLIYVENNIELDPFGDPMELIYNGQVSKLTTSHLGEMNKSFTKYLKEVELLPMDILAFKTQAAANRMPCSKEKCGGIYIGRDYAKLYRNKEYLEKYGFTLPDGTKVVLEEPFKPDLAIVSVDLIDLDSFNSSFEGTAFNCIEVAKTAYTCFVEYHQSIENMSPDKVDIVGQYIDGVIKSDTDKYEKGKWY